MISFFLALVMATLSLFKSLSRKPLSAVYLTQEMITMSQSCPCALSIVMTLVTP